MISEEEREIKCPIHGYSVYHLSSLMVRRLQRSQPDLDITERDVRCVEVAGLCHDLGHGPFSHVWDGVYIPTAIPGCTWKHEDASEMMLDYLVKDNNIDLKPDEVRFIKDLIYGTKRYSVKQFDYIARDRRAVTDGSSTDLKRLVNTARVIHGEICYSEKNAFIVYSLFQDRFNLHKMIYNHKTAKSIEYMIVDALLKADPFMKISERIHDPKKFMFLTDDILLEVERSEAPELSESRQIVRRLRNRDLYKLVDKMFLPWEFKKTWASQYTPARILETAKSMCDTVDHEIQELIRDLREEHIIVNVTVLHHGMGDKFPLDNCKFYGKYDPDNAYPPRREADISHLLPDNFGELLIRQQPIRHRSSTPEVPSTPPQQLTSQLSEGSIFEMTTSVEQEGERVVVGVAPKTPNRLPTLSTSRNLSQSLTMTPTPTPSLNQYMTVPMNFTPKTPNLSRGSGGGGSGPTTGHEPEDEDMTPRKSGLGAAATINSSSLLKNKKNLKKKRDDVDDDDDIQGDKAPLFKKQKA
ncbi:hypothetical protein Clacol_002139 [Clathrus columnatus]|uniref:Deoxynucleoside triphosphate triphosphohydrolase SAMHD1 n=1 Tax=Clathrus columnatus TaxID=1419009 RepID=A0AAV5A3B2_9AGAM|nr:hypothetical protein Clacol_002139 [Clathrus columnatus]